MKDFLFFLEELRDGAAESALALKAVLMRRSEREGGGFASAERVEQPFLIGLL